MLNAYEGQLCILGANSPNSNLCNVTTVPVDVNASELSWTHLASAYPRRLVTSSLGDNVITICDTTYNLTAAKLLMKWSLKMLKTLATFVQLVVICMSITSYNHRRSVPNKVN